MPNYDFLNLSPYEFENLSRDLLQKQLNILLESFANAKDGGIDFRSCKSKDELLIVQCKRYKDLKTLMPVLQAEAEKVKKIKPQRYILVVSIELSPQQKDEIFEIFKPFIGNTADVITKSDLNNLLNLHPEIESKHFKLWLSSVNILSRILKSRIYNQSKFEEDSVKENINIYVENQSYFEALKILKDQNFVIISGIPGIGKTTLARILVYNFLANGYEDFISVSNDINEAYELFTDDRRQVFFYDDFLGKNFLENSIDKNEDQRIVKFIERIKKIKNKKLIFTTREYILNQAKTKFEEFEDKEFELSKCIIDLSKYTKLVKARILYNHLFFSDIGEKYVENLLEESRYNIIINHDNYSPRIVKSMTNRHIFKDIAPNNFFNVFKGFLDNPQDIWGHVYENQISDLSKIILAELVTCGLPIEIEELIDCLRGFLEYNREKYHIYFNNFEFRKSIKELENTFINMQRDNKGIVTISFQNPSIRDFLLNYIRRNEDIQIDLIKSSKFYDQLFTIFTNDKDSTQKILLNNRVENIVVEKIITSFNDLTFLESHSYRVYFNKKSIIYILSEIVDFVDPTKYEALKVFIKEKFQSVKFEDLKDYFERNIYSILLGKILDIVEINEEAVLNYFYEKIFFLYDINIFIRVKDLFDDIYDNWLKTVNDFESKISTVLEESISDYENDEDITSDDGEELSRDIEDIGYELGIDVDGFLNDLGSHIEDKKRNEEEKLERESYEEELYYSQLDNANLLNEKKYVDNDQTSLFESQQSYDNKLEYQPQKLSDDEIIKNMFDSLEDN